MKKKLFCVLLALTLCGSLAIPVFAEPAEEPSVPEESEAFSVKEVPDSPDFVGEEGEFEEEVKTVISFHNHCFENFDWEKMEDGIIIVQCSNCFYSNDSCPTLEIEANMLPVMAQSGLGYCEKCGKSNWGSGDRADPYYTHTEGSTHTKVVIVTYLCRTPECRMAGIGKSTLETDTYFHDWRKGSREGAQSIDGSNHEATYNYSCVCGREKTKPETEAHSLDKYDFGRNYHKGTLHYVEWYCRCVCGYTTTRLESQPCPGNDNGEGCIFGINKVEPPVEVQDVTEPEDAAMPEETVLPEDVITPEETVLPEDTTEPENTDTPEETT